jgi:hypothetical protein
MHTTEEQFLQHLSAAILLCPAQDNKKVLEHLVEAGLGYQGMTLNEVAENENIKRHHAQLLLRGKRGKRKTAIRKLENIRKAAAPLDITFSTGESHENNSSLPS